MSDDIERRSRREGRRLEHLATDTGEGPTSIPETHRELWATSRLEFDRQLLALSSAGVALLLGLVATLSPMSAPVSFFFAVSLASFVVAALMMLYLLRVNAQFLEADASKREARRIELAERLHVLDRAASLLFATGVIAASLIGLVVAFT